MFRNVDAELKKVGLNRGQLAKKMKIRPSTMSLKLNEKTIVTLNEAKTIKKILKSKLPLEELFESDIKDGSAVNEKTDTA